ncbi:MAG: sigma-70 family RNA polymerase sigma factor [Gemmataceae bacterium]|nr:sigma-70 family RNA polymerase sigma factor [Gemmataceae bacterium]
MEPHNPDTRLSQMLTHWTLILEANQGSAEAAASAQEQFLQRYGPVVYRYLLGVVRDPHVADDLAQEFALRFVRGDFRHADPQRGRFRHFVKAVALNLVTDYRRRQKVRPRQLPPESPEPADRAELPSPDDELLESCRHELMNRAWEALAQAQEHTDQPLYAALRLRADHPDLTTAQLAEQLSAQLGKPISANWVRQILFRARKTFVQLLLEVLAQSLQGVTEEHLEQELADLGLLDYCRPALEQRERKP